MDETKLKKLGAELEKARARQAEWTAKVKDLERKYREAENTCIHDIVHAADLTPEEQASIPPAVMDFGKDVGFDD